MKKYKLIKEYPGSPRKHSIVLANDPLLSNLVMKEWKDYWQEIVEQEYEIVSFRMLTSFEMTGRIFSDCSDSKYELEWYLGEVKAKRAEIYSIRRLSDGIIFTLGDRIDFYDRKAIITAFKPERDKTIVETYRLTRQANLKGYDYWSVDILNKAKEKLFTTEDGVDIFEGDLVTWLYRDNLSICNTRSADKNMDCTYTYFSTKEKAQEYIDLHKKQFSLFQIMKAINTLGYTDSIQSDIINQLRNEKS